MHSCYMINGNKYEPTQSTKRKWEDKTERLRDKDGKLLNRTGLDGKPMVCFKCNSEYHQQKEQASTLSGSHTRRGNFAGSRPKVQEGYSTRHML